MSGAKRASRRRAAPGAERAGTVARAQHAAGETLDDVHAFLGDVMPGGFDVLKVVGADVYEATRRNQVRASDVTVLDLPATGVKVCLTCLPLGVRVYGEHDTDREAAVAQAGDRLGFAALAIRKFREKIEARP